jgi:hypothetical protein
MPRYVVLVNWTEQGVKNVKETLQRTDSGGTLADKHGLKPGTFDASRVTWTTRSEGENPRVVGRLTMGILERVCGLDRPYRPRLRRLGAVPVLQRCEKRKLV